MQYDHVDRLLVQWHHQRPDLDCSPMAVVGRLSRMSRMFDSKINATFKKHSLSSVEFDILATLRRFNEPMTPTELYQTLMLSSGAMSTRIEKLVQRGFIERIASSEDRRSCRVVLTPEGSIHINKALEDHVVNEKKMLEPLSNEQCEQLSQLLRAWLLANES
ncbi:MarR family winged helix-turn-helix transcriptional regulator [Vibrio sagamiensis]|uniref:MarR family transcriptional regulator n=1 Tax=Vibrio sagamiensis NBRC 104589 TaxID=1219064 RepID=A0A511QJG9_9VIBR|nr:MarR family transcriptional regulator [Vibrio sagamiensis]PNQ54165.1 MarR family transcriptional regulator [Vibrio agarivorans]GEM77474.1 MarR family transcriptional regulator [Vibrio sagamiensis NBRC 104589]